MGPYAGLPLGLDAWLQELINKQTVDCLLGANSSFLHGGPPFHSGIEFNLTSVAHDS